MAKVKDVKIDYNGEQLSPSEHILVLRRIGKRGPGRYTVTKETGATEDGLLLTNIKVKRTGDYANEA